MKSMGLPIERAVAVIHGFAFILAAVGVAGWYFRVPEHVMFFLAMGIFAAYVVFSAEALRAIEARGAHPQRAAESQAEARRDPVGLAAELTLGAIGGAQVVATRGRPAGLRTLRDGFLRRTKTGKGLTNPAIGTNNVGSQFTRRHRGGGV